MASLAPLARALATARARAVASAIALAAMGLSPLAAVADDGGDQGGASITAQSSLALRAAPLGLISETDGGYRIPLAFSDAPLFADTYLEPGVSVHLTPSAARGGLYLESVPLAILQLRVAAYASSYFGSFGYLHLPADPDDPSSWSLSALGGGAAEGERGSGVMLEASATPRALVGRTVLLAETKLRWARASVTQSYYEPIFDMLLEPSDSYWVTRPTVGRIFALPDRDSWVMAALRWEHGQASGTGVTRDMAALVGLWSLPWTLRAQGEVTLAIVAGYWVRHPNRAGTVYGASQLSVEW